MEFTDCTFIERIEVESQVMDKRINERVLGKVFSQHGENFSTI